MKVTKDFLEGLVNNIKSEVILFTDILSEDSSKRLLEIIEVLCEDEEEQALLLVLFIQHCKNNNIDFSSIEVEL